MKKKITQALYIERSKQMYWLLEPYQDLRTGTILPRQEQEETALLHVCIFDKFHEGITTVLSNNLHCSVTPAKQDYHHSSSDLHISLDTDHFNEATFAKAAEALQKLFPDTPTLRTRPLIFNHPFYEALTALVQKASELQQEGKITLSDQNSAMQCTDELLQGLEKIEQNRRDALNKADKNKTTLIQGEPSLEDINNLYDKQRDALIEDYKTKACMMQDGPSRNMQILGGLLFAVGVALAVTAVVITSAALPLGVVGGICAIGGCGFFAYGSLPAKRLPKELSNDMLNFATRGSSLVTACP